MKKSPPNNQARASAKEQVRLRTCRLLQSVDVITASVLVVSLEAKVQTAMESRIGLLMTRVDAIVAFLVSAKSWMIAVKASRANLSKTATGRKPESARFHTIPKQLYRPTSLNLSLGVIYGLYRHFVSLELVKGGANEQ